MFRMGGLIVTAVTFASVAPALADEPQPSQPAPVDGAGVDAVDPTPSLVAEPEPEPEPAPEPAPPPVDDAPSAEAEASGWGDLTELEASGAPPFETKIYGFIDFHLEKVASTPGSVDAGGATQYESNPFEVDLPNVHVMVQGAVQGKYRYYLNLASPGSGSNTDDEAMVLRNAWVEWPVSARRLTLRVGKTYRRFGLYNEILDAVPTFIGIEPPELFDKDHLLLTRTTSIMAYGEAAVGGGLLAYAVTTGNDERLDDGIPIGADVRFERAGITVGTSFYRSGLAGPSRAVGDGSPRGGVASWMTEDRFLVYGGFAQVVRGPLTVQVEAWQASHAATRDPGSLAVLAAEGDLNEAQLARFFDGGDPTQAARTDADYRVRTGYVRAGYDIAATDRLTVTPYAQLDYYSNPENIADKGLGGDAEAGLADDGRFTKFTLGTVIRPASAVALKIDGSGHLQTFNRASEFYPEIRFSLSYLWELPQ